MPNHPAKRSIQPTDDTLRARVFISCGQRKESEEEKLAEEISARLRSLEFDPYVAVGEQSLRGLKENLFGQINESEYFLFVDFKRERLDDGRDSRGSLFSHQELAIASFLDIDVLAFQELGVKRNDGILGFVQGNAIVFSDRSKLPDLVAECVQQRIDEGKWDPQWRNELVLEREPGEFTDPFIRNLNKYGRFFHIGVQNRHRSRAALNCSAYLVKATNLDTAAEIPLKTIEFKWAGSRLSSAHIRPRSVRSFDAFWILHEAPTNLQFSVFSDASNYVPRIPAVGRYELSYEVVSDNFPAARRSFILNLSNSRDLTTLEPSPAG